MAIQVFACQDQQYPFSIFRMRDAAFQVARILHSGDLVVTPSAGLQVQAAAGSALVQQTVAPEGAFYNGLYYVFNDAPANPYNTILAPVTNPRVDYVVFRVYDVNEQGLSGSSKGQIEWVQGTETAGANVTPGSGGYLAGVTAPPANSMILAAVLQTVGESSIPAANILDLRPRTSGAVNIATTGSRTNTAYGALSDANDQIPNLMLPTNGRIRIGYQALWQQSGAVAARAAIFIGSNQLKIATTMAAPQTQAAILGSLTNSYVALASGPVGLAGVDAGGGAYSGDVTTGQVIGTSGIYYQEIGGIQINATTSGDWWGGPCDIQGLPAGSYTISVQFKASSGSVTAQNRKLWVEVIPFS
jgi:hypothetical protein